MSSPVISTSGSSSPSGPPYVPTNATPGQHPNVHQDIPPSAVFLFLYILSGIFHQIHFQKNRRRGHKFLMSWAMFGFAMARKGTLVLRIAWACRPDNGSVALAATIFVFLGVLIIYIVVLLMSIRVFRARQPRLGWNPVLNKALKINYIILLLVVLVVVPFGIVSGYTRAPTLSKAAFWIERTGVLYFFLFTLLAPIFYLLALLLPEPKPTDPQPENFGAGSMKTKLMILGVLIFFTNFIATFRFATAWAPARPLSNPGWYDTRAAFYVIELGFELAISYTLIFTRFDTKFWIPNGSCKPGDYSAIDLESFKVKWQEEKKEKEAEKERAKSAAGASQHSLGTMASDKGSQKSGTIGEEV